MLGHEKSGAVPPIPSSLRANAWHTLNLNDESQTRPRAHTAPEVTPYLGLRARLSQLWFNRWTILLLLVLVRVVILTGSLNDNIGDAKVRALSACTKVEDIGSAMASMPHYLSVGVNSLASDAITKTVSGLVQLLMLLLEGVEGLLFFIINLYVGTFVCVATALIHGGLDVAIKAVEGATKAMNDAIKTISGQITDTIEDVQDVLNGIPNQIAGAIGSIFGGGDSINIPTIDISSSLDDLQNIRVDATKVVGGLASLNKTIPNFDQVENFTKNAISVPFGLLRGQINESLGAYRFDDSVFPVAKKEALSFCSDNSFLNDFFETLFGIVAAAKIAFLVVIPILAILAIIAMGYLEVRRWRREKQRARDLMDHGYDAMDVVYLSSRPMTAGAGLWLASKLGIRDLRKTILFRWTVAYGTSLPALFVLSLALAGFFSCLCQIIILRLIQKEAPALAGQVGNFADDVVGTLKAASTSWSDDANGVIIKVQDDINDDLFGWVRNATAAVNNTLTTFDNEIDDALDSVFKDTLLADTVRNLVACLIGRKIDAVQAGLTWVHEHAHVTLPLFADDIFSKGANDSVNGDSDLTSFLATPATVTTDEITASVDRVVAALERSIVQEALISTVLLLIYVLVILIGALRALTAAASGNKTRAEGGEQYGMKAVETGSRSSSRTRSEKAAPPEDYWEQGLSDNVVHAGHEQSAGSDRRGRDSSLAKAVSAAAPALKRTVSAAARSSTRAAQTAWSRLRATDGRKEGDGGLGRNAEDKGNGDDRIGRRAGDNINGNGGIHRKAKAKGDRDDDSELSLPPLAMYSPL
ncbi:hypothetical protein VTJ49DRAFT_6562 [Mycothermus thermophilus]|uniref:Plasma membrane fusion protein PRM1 n=1 Tax=Humicola insolens TaxID=85995 RepID=A0ABR3VIV8_HUMIN